MSDRDGFDLGATQRWVTGVLVDPNATAVSYEAEKPGWQRTFLQIVLPLHVAALLASVLLAWIFGTANMYAAGSAGLILVALIWALAASFVAAFVFDFCAGLFKGQRRFDAAYAALALAFVPAAVGNVLGTVPWIGWLISLVATIYALVLAYRFVGVFMTVPEDKRVLHFVVSLVVMFVLSIVVVTAMVGLFGPDLEDYAGDYDAGSDAVGGGLWGGLERQADFAEQAAQDVYDPPRNGEISEAQMAAYVRVLERTAQLRSRLGKQLEDVGAKSEDQSPGLGDIFGAVSDAARIGTAEMEVVKTAGGNWAEHQWVRNQLETARVQQDGTPAIEHNYALFQAHRELIEQFE